MRTALTLSVFGWALGCSGAHGNRPAAAPERPTEFSAALPPGAPVRASPAEPTGSEQGEPATPRAAAGTRMLEVPGFDAALVSFPGGDISRQPVIVAAHGAGDDPAGQCEMWREVLGGHAVILCLAGPRVAVGSEGRYFPDHFALEKIAFASLEALRGLLPDPSRAARVVYAGYSQGATMGALMIVSHGDTCPRLALLEGGVDGWTLARAEKYRQTGGERVLFVCGTAHCRKRAEASSQALLRAGVAARVVADLSAGHTYGGGVEQALRESFAWLVEDDSNWNRGDAPASTDAHRTAPEAPASRAP